MDHDNPIVFVVDDDRSIRDSLRNLLGSAGLRVETFASAQEFLTSRRPQAPSCLVLDVQLPGWSGLDLQQELAKVEAHLPIVFITGHGDIPMSVRAMKAGAIESSSTGNIARLDDGAPRAAAGHEVRIDAAVRVPSPGPGIELRLKTGAERPVPAEALGQRP